MKKTVFALAAAAALLGGCTTVPYTQEMRDKYGMTPENLRKVQFYNSDEIVLERHIQRKAGKPTPGNRLELTQTDVIKKVTIPPETPGVVVGVTNDMLEISFEEGRSLFFGSSPARRKEVGGLYCLLARDWTDRRGTVGYGGETYLTAPGNGAVHLVVNLDDVRRFRIVNKTLKGVTVADHEFSQYYSTVVGRRVSETNAPAAPAADAPVQEPAGK